MQSISSDVRALIEEALVALDAQESAQALALLEKALTQSPNSAEVRVALGLAALRNDEPVTALGFVEEAHQINPNLMEAAEVLAIIHAKLGHLTDAMYFGKLSTAMKPSPVQGLLPAWLGRFADHFMTLNRDPLLKAADALATEERWGEAAQMYQREISLNQNSIAGWRGFASALIKAGRPFDAQMAFQPLRALAPNDPADLSLLAQAITAAGQHDTGLGLHERALRQAGDRLSLHSARLADWRDHPTGARHGYSRAHAAFAQALTKDSLAADFPPEPLAGRKLKVGLVSGGMRTNAGLDSLLPTFWQRDDALGWELYCYSNTNVDDPWTRRLRNATEGWSDIAELDDETAAYLVMNDAPDVLIDLDGHSPAGRPGLALYQPVANIVAALGLPEQVGHAGIAAVLGDAVTHPDDSDTIRVPGGLFALPEEPLAALPDKADDEPTRIGIRASRRRLNAHVVGILADAMSVMSDVVLVFDEDQIGGPAGFGDMVTQFGWHGLSERIALFNGEGCDDPHRDFYREIDLLIDAGATTDADETAYALSLGVPVVTLAGHTPWSRQAASLLSHLGLTDWVATAPLELAAKIVDIAASRGASRTARQRALDAVAKGTNAAPKARAAALIGALSEWVSKKAAG